MIADYNGDVTSILQTETAGEVPILATRNLVIFPGVIMPILVGRQASIKLVERLEREGEDTIFAVFCQKDATTDSPGMEDLHQCGVYAKLIRVLDLPGTDNKTAIVQAQGRCRLHDIVRKRPFLMGMTTSLPERFPANGDKEFDTAYEDMQALAVEYIRKNDEIPDESQFALSNISNAIISINFICSNMPFSVEDKMDLLREDELKDRLFRLLKIFNRETQLLELKQNIRMKTREDLD